MDIVDQVRIAVTVAGFLCFLGICVWAYSRAAKPAFEEAARLPFLEDDDPVLANDHKEGN